MSKFAEAYADILQKEINRKRRMRIGFWITLVGGGMILLGLAISYSFRHDATLRPWKMIADTAALDTSTGWHAVYHAAIDSTSIVHIGALLDSCAAARFLVRDGNVDPRYPLHKIGLFWDSPWLDSVAKGWDSDPLSVSSYLKYLQTLRSDSAYKTWRHGMGKRRQPKI